MSLFDFLTQPRTSVQPGAVTPNATALDQDGLLSSVGPMSQAPVVTEKPSLLSGALKYLGSNQNLMGIAAGLKGLGGDENAGFEVAQLNQQRQQRQQQAQAQQKKQADLQRKNAAFKAAYRPGADGKVRFDPAAYVDALGDAGEADIGEIASMHNAMAPKTGVSGDTPYTMDDETGGVTWGQPRPMSHSEQLAEQRAQEQERRNQVLEDIMRGNLDVRRGQLGVSQHREGRVGAGGGGHGGGGVPALPPGFMVEK